MIINAIIFFSNMPINSTKQYGEDGLLQDTFEKSIKMSTYLVAFMIMDFTSRSTTTSSNVLVSVYVDIIPRAVTSCHVLRRHVTCFYLTC